MVTKREARREKGNERKPGSWKAEKRKQQLHNRTAICTVSTSS